MNGQYKIGDIVLGNWTLTRLLGEGSYGKVYEAERVDFGTTYKAAIKIVTIPQSQSEITNAKAEGMDDESVTTYFRGFVEELVQEFALMSRLKGTANVVSYEDHTVVEHTEGLGWDIIIRMELLTPLLDYTVDHPMTRRDVMQLGIDMCKALELCQRYNIVHRDIKPENIFVSELGDYKLGDFGIARTVEKTTGGLSKKGTYTYMAPEVYREEPYNSSVDIYSLGIVLYRLLNDNRAPFLPAYPAPIKHSDRDSALKRRLSGEVFPQPKNADGRLAEIVLKACAYKPEDRYSSPMQMRQELEAILYEQGEASLIYPLGDETPLKSIRNIPTGGTDDASDETLGAFTSVPEDSDVVVQDKTVHEQQTKSTEGSVRLPVTRAAEDSDETIGAFSDIPYAKDAEETMGASDKTIGAFDNIQWEPSTNNPALAEEAFGLSTENGHADHIVTVAKEDASGKKDIGHLYGALSGLFFSLLEVCCIIQLILFCRDNSLSTVELLSDYLGSYGPWFLNQLDLWMPYIWMPYIFPFGLVFLRGKKDIGLLITSAIPFLWSTYIVIVWWDYITIWSFINVIARAGLLILMLFICALPTSRNSILSKFFYFVPSVLMLESVLISPIPALLETAALFCVGLWHRHGGNDKHS